tara:strand:+ start:905 stop:1429 length:525 start_codon:yes stop_codon:yes gene_type:complete
MIKKVSNPMSMSYLSLKQTVLSKDFPWNYAEETTPGKELEGHENIPGYTHVFLIAPGNNLFKYAAPNSPLLEKCLQTFRDILLANDIAPKLFLRAAANAVHSTEKGLPSVPHIDHDEIPHMNIIIYLTPTNGGYISCDGKTYVPEEDDVLLFSGEHYLLPPTKGRRVCLVGTFL